jgi:arsenical pump membrane protein
MVGRHAQFLAYYAMASVLTVLTSNDVVILTLTPIVIHFAKASHTDPAPLLFATFYAANTWGMTLLIGCVPAYMLRCRSGAVS